MAPKRSSKPLLGRTPRRRRLEVPDSAENSDDALSDTPLAPPARPCRSTEAPDMPVIRLGTPIYSSSSDNEVESPEYRPPYPATDVEEPAIEVDAPDKDDLESVYQASEDIEGSDGESESDYYAYYADLVTAHFAEIYISDEEGSESVDEDSNDGSNEEHYTDTDVDTSDKQSSDNTYEESNAGDIFGTGPQHDEYDSDVAIDLYLDEADEEDEDDDIEDEAVADARIINLAIVKEMEELCENEPEDVINEEDVLPCPQDGNDGERRHDESDDINAASAVIDISGNVERFRTRLTNIIEDLRVVATATKSGDFASLALKPFSWTACHFLRSHTTAEMADTIFAHTPSATKRVLGAETVSVWDLLQLKLWNEMTDHWGVYISLSRLQLNQHSSPAPPFPNSIVDKGGLRTEAGVYVGSSTCRGGVRARIRQHRRNAQVGPVPANGRPELHYQFTGRHGVHEDFFVFCQFPQTVERGYAGFAEGVAMTWLNVVDLSAAPTHFWNATSRALVADIRGQLPGIVDLGRFGLNRAWSLSQGWRSEHFLTTTCHNCGYQGLLVAVRRDTNTPECAKCHRYRTSPDRGGSGELWTRKPWEERHPQWWYSCRDCGKRKIREGSDGHWTAKQFTGQSAETRRCGNCSILAGGVGLRCENPNCGVSLQGQLIYGKATSPRCQACHKYRKAHGGEEERPRKFAEVCEAARRLRTTGCTNPTCLRPQDGSKFVNSMGARRCASCYGHFKRYGTERPYDVQDKWRHPLPKVKDGCKNPACGKPEELGGYFFFVGDLRRCNLCNNYQKAHPGMERPDEVCVRDRWRYPLAAKDGCKNPVCGKPEDTDGLFHNLGDLRRCNLCHRWNNDHPDMERPEERCARDEWRCPRVKEGCKNPACGKPEDTDGLFHNMGDLRRCAACYSYRQAHPDMERPEERCARDEWRCPRVKEGCKNPACGKPEGTGGIFRRLGDLRRCSACYDWQLAHPGEDRPEERCARDKWRDA